MEYSGHVGKLTPRSVQTWILFRVETKSKHTATHYHALRHHDYAQALRAIMDSLLEI